jgi:hypothetical protein
MNTFFNILSKNLDRITRENQGSYLLILGEVKGKKIAICTKKGEHSIYAKITLEELLSSLDCREVEYNPHGLYVFAETEEELAEKTISKITRVIEASFKTT